ncbi:hypothetical protein KM295_16345 [Natronomonas sp. F2-12]|jgi:hypothetical protein|uniref:Uncharacterized protein n=1 Tax=Natronomonas aquatica TaxID=2841590 RepID=A0A9R1D7W8_9EURY|nr:hypothetical protein [Natronomonas aquatica]MCQ4335020.1 hypothetical protein [Natronomonas aquatica]
MFNLFGNDEGHDDRVEAQADLLRGLGYSDVRADHTSEYPDPKKRNGRVPDVTADSPFGRDPVVEIDTGTTTSKRDQRQLDDLSSGLDLDESLIQIDDDDRLFGGW